MQNTARKQRDSNIELLRIVAMLFVILLHILQFAGSSATDCSKLVWFVNSFASVAVPCFIMISGWYGIRLTASKIMGIIFQMFMFWLVGLAASYFTGNFRPVSLAEPLKALSGYNYSFVMGYIILMIAAPAINTFVEYALRERVRLSLALFFAFQTLLRFILNHNWWADGFSVINYFGVYALARYLSTYRPGFIKFKAGTDLVLYVAISTVLALGCLFWINRTGSFGRMFNYTNPLLLCSALCLVLFFTKISFKSRAVNFLAAGCFGAYLMHMEPRFKTSIFDPISKCVVAYDSTAARILSILAFSIILLLAGIMLYKLFDLIWRLLLRAFKPGIAE